MNLENVRKSLFSLGFGFVICLMVMISFPRRIAANIKCNNVWGRALKSAMPQKGIVA